MLIEDPDDNAEILDAEDEAIRLAANPPPEPEPPGEGDIARLIERLTNAPEASDAQTS